MSGKSELELLEALPRTLGSQVSVNDYQALYDKGLVESRFSYPDDWDVVLTEDGKVELEKMREIRRKSLSYATTGNTHMVLNRLGYAYPGQILKIFHHELCRAHHEHPAFADNTGQAMCLLGEEFGEACKALNEDDLSGAVAELGQVIAVSLRTMELLLEELGGES